MNRWKIFFVLLLFLAGIAIGINYTRGKPLLSDPFLDKPWDQKIRKAFRALTTTDRR